VLHAAAAEEETFQGASVHLLGATFAKMVLHLAHVRLDRARNAALEGISVCVSVGVHVHVYVC